LLFIIFSSSLTIKYQCDAL